MSELDKLLTRARDAEPADRIALRDRIAAHGEAAIDAMSDWLGDRRLAAFAIRVLERIGRQAEGRAAAVAALTAIDQSELPAHLVDDLDRSLTALGSPPGSAGRKTAHRGSRATRSPGRPGVSGRGYWVMRTSPWERPFIWAEAQGGRLRQGWGVVDQQDLRVIEAELRRGDYLDGWQREARGALRMLASWDHAMHLGDVVVAPNLPEYGRLSVFRVTGSYEWDPGPPLQWGERFGHVLPVELLAADIDRRGADVSDGLRSALRAQTRLYNITGYGGDVERLIGGDVGHERAEQGVAGT